MMHYLGEVATYQAEWFGLFCLAVMAAVAVAYVLAVLTEDKQNKQ